CGGADAARVAQCGTLVPGRPAVLRVQNRAEAAHDPAVVMVEEVDAAEPREEAHAELRALPRCRTRLFRHALAAGSDRPTATVGEEERRVEGILDGERL